MGISDTLADRYVARGVNLLRFEAGEREKILAHLWQLEDELVAKLAKIDPSAPLRASSRRNRLEKLLAETRSTIQTAYQDISTTSAAGLRGLAKSEAAWVSTTVNSAAGISIMDTMLTPESLRAVVSNALIEGAPSKEWWRRQRDGLTRKFSDQIRAGMSGGEGVDDMVRRIRGKATGRRHKYIDAAGKERWYVEFKGGIMDTGTRQARAMVRTSVQQVAADARREMYQANSDVVKGIQQISTLDGRTTDICMAYSGAAWNLDYEPIMGNSLPYNGGVPRHWACRSSETAVLKSFRDLGVDLDEIPPSTRASMDGQVAEDLSFDDWLDGKDAAFQDKMLGKGRAQLYRDKKITLTDLVDQSGNPLTLEELTGGGDHAVPFGGKEWEDIPDAQNHSKKLVFFHEIP